MSAATCPSPPPVVAAVLADCYVHELGLLKDEEIAFCVIVHQSRQFSQRQQCIFYLNHSDLMVILSDLS